MMKKIRIKKIDLPSTIMGKKIALEETQKGLLRGALGAIPYLGPFMVEAIFEINGRIYQRRINETVELLKKEVSNIKESTISVNYLESDDFFDFTRRLFESTIKVKIEEKRKSLAKIYFHAIQNKSDFEGSNTRLFFDFIVQLSPAQIEILKFIDCNVFHLQEVASYSKFFEIFKNESTINLQEYEFKYYCNDLENKALVSFGSGLDDFLSSSQLIVTAAHKDPSIVITNFGKEFIEFLRD